MRTELMMRLYLCYPGLFRNTGPFNDARARYIEIQCGDGWFPLIDVLSETLVKLDKNITDFFVYEQFSRLEVNLKGAHDLTSWTILDVAGAFSERVCEVTGLPAHLVPAEALWVQDGEALKGKAAKPGQSRDRTYVRDAKVGRAERLERKYVPRIQDRRCWNKSEAEEFLSACVPCIDSINIRPADFDLVDVITRIIAPRYSLDDRRSWSASTKFLSITWTDDHGLTFDLDENALRYCDPKEFEGMESHEKKDPGSWLDRVVKLRTMVNAVNMFSGPMSKRIDQSALHQSMMMEISTPVKLMVG
jgi:hypothetical protein